MKEITINKIFWAITIGHIITSSFIIYVYIKVKMFRKKPGDLFFMIAV